MGQDPESDRRSQPETPESVKQLLSEALDEVEHVVQCHDDELHALRAEIEENRRIIGALNRRFDQLIDRAGT